MKLVVASSDVAPSSLEARSELVFGLVGAIGTDLARTCEELEATVTVYGYTTVVISISECIRDLPSCANLPPEKNFAYYEAMINGGDQICMEAEDDGALADAAIARIRTSRVPDEKTAFVIRSLKRPGELERLRGVYGGMFYAIGVFADKNERAKRLSGQDTGNSGDRDHTKSAEAARLIAIDENEKGKWGQKVSDTFTQVDYVVRSDVRDEMRSALERLITLIFEKPHVAPTVGEVAMMHAHAAGLRSADLSRQIGAVVIARDGRILVTGCNEVPRGGGGLYWESDLDDRRDFKIGHDLNDRKKKDAIVEFLSRIKNMFKDEFDLLSETTLYDQIQERDMLDGTTLDSLIEFGRVSHAEMSAITSATLGGVALRDCDLYSTTFPCHMCTRLIIACGIRNVFYIEPYPKSAALQMYGDGEIVVNPRLTPSQVERRLFGENVDDRRTFMMPFDGVAPRRYPELFAKKRSKSKKEGSVLSFVPRSAKPRRTPDFTTMYEAAESFIAQRATVRLEELRRKAKTPNESKAAEE